MRKIVSLFLLLSFVFIFSGCNSFERERYEEDIDVTVDEKPVSVQALLPQMSEIAGEYGENLVPMHINIVFDGDVEISKKLGIIDFTFGSYNEEENISTIVIITYDMQEEKAYKMSFEQGNAAFETDLSDPVNEQIMQSTFEDIFAVIEDDSNYSDKLDGVNVKLTIEMTNENMKITIL